MRFFLIFLLLFVLFSCKQELETPNFLIGNWKRTNGEKDKQTYEIWNKDFSGIGYSLRDRDTVFKEELKIVQKKGDIYLQVVGVNQQPTLFKITQMDRESLICENLSNDFPKEIAYTLDKDKLKAKVSSEDFSIDFIFERIK